MDEAESKKSGKNWNPFTDKAVKKGRIVDVAAVAAVAIAAKGYATGSEGWC